MNRNDRLHEIENKLARLEERMTYTWKRQEDLDAEVRSLLSRISTQEARQEENLRNFEERDRELAAFKQEMREAISSQNRQLEKNTDKISPFIFWSDLLRRTPGGFKTWAIVGCLVAVMVLTGIDLTVRAIGLERLAISWLTRQTPLELVAPKEE